MGPEMDKAIKRLAWRISEKNGESYSMVICTLRCKFSFSMMRSALVCLRGSRTLKPRTFNDTAEDLQNTPATIIAHESRLI